MGAPALGLHIAGLCTTFMCQLLN